MNFTRAGRSSSTSTISFFLAGNFRCRNFIAWVLWRAKVCGQALSGGRPGSKFHTQDWKSGVVHDVLREAPVHHMEKARATVRGHGDHVGVDPLGEAQDALLDTEVVVDGGGELAQFMS